MLGMKGFLLGVTKALRLSVTGAAVTSSVWGDAGVLFVEGVSVDAVGLASIDSHRAVATKEIVSVRLGLKMQRVATRAVAAEMIKFFVVWDRANELLIQDFMNTPSALALPAN